MVPLFCIVLYIFIFNFHFSPYPRKLDDNEKLWIYGRLGTKPQTPYPPWMGPWNVLILPYIIQSLPACIQYMVQIRSYIIDHVQAINLISHSAVHFRSIGRGREKKRNSGNGGIDACLQPETGNKLNRRLNSNGTGTKLQWPN